MSLEKRNGPLPPYLTPHAEGAVLSVRAQPGARRTAVVGPYGSALKIAVMAPPDKGRANRALSEFLAEILGVKLSAVVLMTGETSQDKRFLLSGLSAEAAAQRLDIPKTLG